MAQKVQLDNELAAARGRLRKRNNLRKQNDDYNAWLAKGTVRDEDELMHERREVRPCTRALASPAFRTPGSTTGQHVGRARIGALALHEVALQCL